MPPVKTIVPPPEVQGLVQLLEGHHSAAVLEVERGGAAAGNWWLTLAVGDVEIVTEWRPLQGFGIYDVNEDGYGAKPSIVLASASAAAEHLLGMLGDEHLV